MVGDTVPGVEVSECGGVELSAVITDQGSGNTEPADNIPENEFFNLFLRDGGQGFGLGPFGEVVHCNDREPDLTLPGGERTD